MQSDRWQRVEDLFRELVELSPEARDAGLDRACGDAPEVRAEVESLLASHDGVSAAFLEELDSGGASKVLESLAGGEVPDRIGPYRLGRELGRGGMGVVYLAERVDGQFDQRVALKLIKRGMDSDSILRRFLRERQILARLEHPNIARLLDGGITEGGQPWFAMELVDGMPLTLWCDRERLGLDARIALFTEVCAAVSYAHRALVVHRDLKPSNVLVTRAGEVKLLDFGIAKLLGNEDEGQTLLENEHEMRLVTPEYGAPEQLRGEPVGTTTDVYALGAILYELLCGCQPYVLENRSVETVVDVVTRSNPMRPSTRVSAEAAAARRATSRRLRNQLRGDLDTIVLKALRKNPERRYSGSDELAEDLRRFTGGLPVLARPAGWPYRGRRFVRRHWFGVSMAALVVASLTAGLIGTAWQGRRLAAERDRVRAEAARTDQVKDFLVDLFRASEPSHARGEQLTAAVLLDRGIERIDDEFSDQPDLRAELLATVANASIELGDLDRGRDLYERALALEYGASPEAALRRAEGLNGLGIAYVSLQRLAEGEEALRQALDIRQRFAGAESLEVAETSNELAVALATQRKWREAHTHYERALGLQQRHLGESHVDTLATHYNLGSNLLGLGKYAAGDRVLQVIGERQRLVTGDDHPDLATTLNTRAWVRRALGDYIEAERLYGEALRIRRRVLGEDHPRTMSSTNNLAMLLLSKGDSHGAEVLMRGVLAQNLRQFGPQHPYVAMAKGNLGLSVAEAGRFEEAMGLLGEAEAIHLQTSGPNSARVAGILVRQAETILSAEGPLDDAATKVDRALEIFGGEPDPEVEKFAFAIGISAAIRTRLGRTREAEELYGRALEMQAAKQGENHPETAATLRGLGDLLVATGRSEEAEPKLRRVQQIWQAAFPSDHWRHGEALVSLGICQRENGAVEVGERLVRDGLAQLERARGVDDWRTVTLRRRAAATGVAGQPARSAGR